MAFSWLRPIIMPVQLVICMDEVSNHTLDIEISACDIKGMPVASSVLPTPHALPDQAKTWSHP